MITQEEVSTITQSILDTMFRIDSDSVELVGDHAELESTQVGVVHITGQWNVTVLVQASLPLQQTLAAAFFDTIESNLTDNDICDTLIEITNMIGGNIKGLVPSPSSLSIPTLKSRKELDLVFGELQIISRTCLVCQGEPLQIILSESVSQQDTALNCLHQI